MSAAKIFREDEHYVAEVVSHDFRKSTYNGVTKPQLVLGVVIKGRAKKKFDAANWIELPEEEKASRTLYFTLDPADQKFDRVVNELKHLGFEHTDPKLLVKLHPAHPKHISFVGKEVLTRVWLKDNNKESWFLVVPKEFEEYDLGEFEAFASENKESYQTALDRAATADA